MKRTLAVLLCLVLCLSLMPMAASAADSGKCGPNLTWSLSGDTLYITGTGAMYDYTSGSSLPIEEPDSVKRIYVDWNVTSIGDYAFHYLRNVTQVTITDDVKSIGKYAFFGCGCLKDELYVGLSDSLLIIGESAFGSSGLKEVFIPGTVRSIGTAAFSNTPITTATLGEGVPEVPDHLFYNCPSLSKVTLPSTVERIGELAFAYDSALKTLGLPSGLKTVGNSAFICSGIQSLSIPASATSLGYLDSDGLESISVAAGNPNYASQDGVLFNKDKTELLLFPECMPQISYTIPSTVATIGKNAFRYSRYLISLTIPASVTSIEKNAFYACHSLSDVYYEGSQTQWNAVVRGEYNDSLDSATMHFVAKPTITTQPKSVTAVEGKTAVFQVAADGAESYQWQYRTGSSGTWKDSPAAGNQTAKLSVPATTGRNGYQYRCRVTNSAGTTTSSTATLTVTSASKPSITTQPKSVTASAGATVTFKVVATGAESYQWQYRTSSSGTWKDSPATGNQTAKLTVPATAGRNGYQYRCKVTNSAGTVTSSTATLTVH